jgi:hypothetical protein
MTTSASPVGTLRFDILEHRICDAVQRVATTRPELLNPFRDLYTAEGAGVAPGELDVRLDSAAERLGLDLLEAAVLGLAAAPELDPRYGRLYGFLHDDLARGLVTPRLLGALLSGEGVTPADVMACLAEDAPLLRRGALRFVDAGAASPAADRPLKVAGRLAAFLLGTPLAAGAAAAPLRRLEPSGVDAGREDEVARIAGVLATRSRLPVLVAGPDAPVLLARAAGRGLVLLAVSDVVHPDAIADAELACALEDRILVLDRIDQLATGDRDAVRDALSRLPRPPVLCAAWRDGARLFGDRAVLTVAVRGPSLAERSSAWQVLAGTEDVADVSAKFRLSIGQIAEAAVVAKLAAARREAATPVAEDLDLGAREASSSRLGDLAQRLQPEFTWDDLVMPDRQLDALHSISSYLRHRDRVLSGWGFERRVARNQGLKILFAGESGTGKTMAAQVLAGDLGLEIFQVDLATIVSKYVGETEKNLSRIFGAAEGSNAVLFFDEADALFGKRSEVSDAHDRYANIEVAYLLQRMDGYAGAVILATNYRRNIDDAFMRRLDFVIDFPFPEPADRKRLWRALIPPEAPLRRDVDFDLLATRFKLSGGAIRNCTLAAAFLAAEEGDEITMSQLVRAVGVEYAKHGRLTVGADFEGFQELVRRPRARHGEGG